MTCGTFDPRNVQVEWILRVVETPSVNASPASVSFWNFRIIESKSIRQQRPHSHPEPVRVLSISADVERNTLGGWIRLPRSSRDDVSTRSMRRLWNAVIETVFE